MKYTITVHPLGLGPLQSAKAWWLRKKCDKSWSDVAKEVKAVNGKRPGLEALKNAVKRQSLVKKNDLFCKTKYENCGRNSDLSDEDRERVVDFVVQWRSKRFCTANYIIRELKLKCKRKTIHRVLNAAGFHWRPVPKKSKLTDKELKGRQIWVDERLHWTQDTWKKACGLVLDGVTLTRDPKALTGAEKHAAQ